MALILPINQTSAYFGFACELDGVTYQLSFRWNDRASAWFFDLADGDGNPLASGIKVVVNFPLLSAVRQLANLPAGEMIAIDTMGLDEDPGFEDLGRRTSVGYLTAEELAE